MKLRVNLQEQIKCKNLSNAKILDFQPAKSIYTAQTLKSYNSIAMYRIISLSSGGMLFEFAVNC
jgi:hypothetical protein